MRHDLKVPCKHCPFRRDLPAIRFACEERASEIEESAYRYGFPCHKSAELVEDDQIDERNGYVAGANTQLCIGYAILQLNESGNSPWPGIHNSQRIIDRIDQRVEIDTRRLVFQSTDDFIAANKETRRRPARRRKRK